MRILTSTAAIAAAALFSTSAFAQTTPAPAPPAPAAPAAVPAPAAPLMATDEEVTKFVTAVIAVEAITKDPAIADADKQPKMAEKIKEVGLEPARFNELATGFQSDPVLKTRVQAELAKQKPAVK